MTPELTVLFSILCAVAGVAMVSAIGGTTVVMVLILRAMQRQQVILREHFAEWADRLQGQHVATALYQHSGLDPTLQQPQSALEELRQAEAEAGALGLDLKKPADVEEWNRLIERSHALRGLPT